jgi:hypothetical protein
VSGFFRGEGAVGKGVLRVLGKEPGVDVGMQMGYTAMRVRTKSEPLYPVFLAQCIS